MTDEERLMRENFRSAFAALGTKTIAEIEEIAKDPNQPIPYALQAKALSWFFKKGNPAIYKEIHDRTIGKSIQQVELSGPNGSPVTFSNAEAQKLTDEELKEQLKTILAENP